MPEKPWLLLPVKSLECGKRRLDSVLNKRARRVLNEFFVHRMVALAADFPGLANTAIVSDAADTLLLAASLGARTIRCRRPGLNPAVSLGARELHRDGARKILVMPIDLPLVQTSDLLEIAALGEHHAFIICPDRHLTGTNAIFLSQQLPMQFHFGKESYQRHRAEACRCGVTPLLHFNERIAQDVDAPQDLAILGCNGRDALPSGAAILSKTPCRQQKFCLQKNN